jgi:outer membrane protein assembly factor BamB
VAVGSGVLVGDGVAYTAAGIANYDGTHVYALDAGTGAVRWQNSTSGNTEGGQGAGVSVQGDLLLYEGKLYLAGGLAIDRKGRVLATRQDGRVLCLGPDA